MEKEKIIKNAAYRLGIVRCHHILTECSIDMASALIQYDSAMRDEKLDTNLIDTCYSAINGCIADLLIAIDLVCTHNRREDVKAEIQKRMVRLDVQNLSAELP